ncbi:lithostathine-like [Eriocheir sinensis]|uniref:lithostathine-like n=1 Tax=Eriocheir sinensis TaxID=95602 RepID=UPI0021CAC632|nr:lithostathine-like [Eriocheir sinensis]
MKATTLTLLSLIILRLGADQGQAQENAQQYRYMCPPDFIHLGHSCYFFSREMATWHSAHFSCRDRGSQLASLETRWEDNNVRSYLNRPEFAPLNRWVGGIYNWSRRQWKWASSGAEMAYNGFLTQSFPRSSRWRCVYLSPDIGYRWNHKLCTTAMHYLCETAETRLPNNGDSAATI